MHYGPVTPPWLTAVMPTFAEIEAEMAQWRRDVAAADWRNLPKGHYALPIHDVDDTYDLLGYLLFERVVPRTYKNGRRVGSDKLRSGATYCWPDADPARLRAELAENHAHEYDHRHDVYQLLQGPDEHRMLFGKILGKCGWCGKTLSDPESKMLGIGPDCRRGLKL